MNDDILKILAEAGERGLRLQKLVLHVYNAGNSLFHPVDMEEVRSRVTSFVHREQRKGGMVEHTRWGVYRLNMQNLTVRWFLQSLQEKKTSNSSSCNSNDVPADSPKNPQKPNGVQGPTLFE